MGGSRVHDRHVLPLNVQALAEDSLGYIADGNHDLTIIAICEVQKLDLEEGRSLFDSSILVVGHLVNDDLELIHCTALDNLLQAGKNSVT